MASQRRVRAPLVVLLLSAFAFSVVGPPAVHAREHEKADPRGVPVKSLDEALKSGRILPESVEAAQTRGFAPVMVQVALPSPFRPEGELTGSRVEAQRQAIAAGQRAILKNIDGTKFDDVKQYESIPWIAMWAGTDALTALVADPNVFRIIPDRVRDLQLGSSLQQIGAAVVRATLGNVGAGQTVAILDTGVDGSNPALAGKVVSEGCFSTSFPLQSSNLCPNGDSTAAGSGAPCGLALCWHGTHVAGIAAANGGGQFGVAPGASIIAIQVFSSNGAWDSDVIQGLERVYALRTTFNIAAVNLSLGSGFHTSEAACDDDNRDYKDIVDNLRAVQIATVAGSGNRANPFRLGIGAPACVSSVISVGATMDRGPAEAIGEWTTPGGGQPSSQTTSFLDLLAPGDIVFPSNSGSPNAAQVGTSFAAPHVTGAFAVLQGFDRWRSVNDMFDAMVATGKPITDSRPTQPITTPRLQLNAAVEAFTQRPLPPTNVQASPLGGTSMIVTWINNSGAAPGFRVTVEPPASSLLPPRSVTVGLATSAVVGTQTAADGTVLTLHPDTTYTVIVSACGPTGLCNDSQPITARTLNTLPDPPVNLRAANVTSSGVTLEWDQAGSNPVTHFRLVRYVCGLGYDCDPTIPAIQVGGSERSFVVGNLTGNWSVHWRIQACNNDGCGVWVDGPRTVTTSPGSAPAAPTNLHLCGQGGVPFEACLINRITLVWNDNAGNEDRHEFQWSIAQEGTPPWQAAWNTATLGPNAQSYSFTSWISGLIYYFQVRACNIYGCSGWSNMASYTMP